MLLNHRKSGFTLIELLICITLLATILIVSSNSVGNLVDRQRSQSEIKGLMRAFHFARTAAISNAQIVTICPLDEHSRCTTNWNGPVTIFLDPDNQKALNDGNNLLHVYQGTGQGHFQPAPSKRRYFQFSSLGTARGTMGNVTWCARNDRAFLRQQLIVSRSGRLRLAQDRNGDGIREKFDGTPISC
jgi:prepilin-type N-terminal cleavage/methylation domain-containing protein